VLLNTVCNLTFVRNFERKTIFEVYHSWLSQKNSVFNLKHVYYKTTSNIYQNSNLSVNYIASYIFTYIFVAAIDPYILCGGCTPMFVDKGLWAIQRWKWIKWQHSKLPVTSVILNGKQWISNPNVYVYNKWKHFPSTLSTSISDRFCMTCNNTGGLMFWFLRSEPCATKYCLYFNVCT
jgi:hypothetical protein